ncbi:hypothetical protein [Mycolicibacterium sp.]|uniref:hypothetical protein n=1 Tax=Mycolicibacterium sp. TaxID=2320850 RepID=UPI003D0EAD1D
MRSYPAHEDLGLNPEADRTEDLRRSGISDAAGAGTPTASEPTNQLEAEKGKFMTTISECRHCTMPTAGAAVCPFCATYTPPESPAQRLDVAVNRVDLLRHDINSVLQELPADVPLFAVADIVTALGHLRQAAVLIDRANDVLEAAAAEVKR